MSADHIVSSFDEELNQVHNSILRMANLADSQLDCAIRSILDRNAELAAMTVEGDQEIDDIEEEIDAQVIKILALRQPMADDLRASLAALKISSEIERIGDYAANVAKRAITLAQAAPVRPLTAIPHMTRTVREMVRDVIQAYMNKDVEQAIRVWNRDEEMDGMYSSLFRELLTYMMEDPRNISGSVHVLFIAKHLERIGDRATNIAEMVHFQVTGKQITGSRHKHDEANFTMASLPDMPKRGD